MFREQKIIIETFWNKLCQLFKYEVIFDASGSHTTCEHPIGRFIYDFGDGSNLTTTELKTIHYYSKIENYKAKMIAEATCPQTPPNTVEITIDVSVRLKNLKILRLIEKRTAIPSIARIKTKDHFLFRILNKEDIKIELDKIKEVFSMNPDEFYKVWKEGKIHGFQATKFGNLYEFYRKEYL